MAHKKLPYKEGDWFAIPLGGSSYGLGLIARSNPKGKVLLGYFFAPKSDGLPQENDIARLTAKDALIIEKFGDLGLYNGKWPVIGNSENWDRKNWPLPEFVREDVISGEVNLICYSEDDLTLEVSNRPLSKEKIDDYPEDGLSGYLAIEKKLQRLLE